MTKIVILCSLIIGLFFLWGCSDSPSSSLKDEQFALINNNVKQLLGDDYEAKNFSVTEENYSDAEETEYIYSFTFDLNKPYLMFEGKEIPGELRFSKNSDGEWVCTLNSGNALGFFNLLKR